MRKQCLSLCFVAIALTVAVSYLLFAVYSDNLRQVRTSAPLYTQKRKKCNSRNPCSCYKRKRSCLCAFGTKLDQGCIQKDCTWTENGDGRGICRHCSPRNCEACVTQEACQRIETSENFCKWTKVSEQKYSCATSCSIHSCGVCERELCEKKFGCMWCSCQNFARAS